jgi:outer membrane protein
MFKKSIYSIVVLMFLGLTMQAQRVAIVDVTGVLESLPSYNQAQAEVDKVSAKWRQDIALEYDKIKSMYNKYQAESVLLSEDVKVEREDEILEKEKQVRELQKRRFGPDGDLFRKRQELVSPVQDEVFKAIEDYAKVKGYDLIFDRSGAAGLLYSNEEYDKTDEIKRELGIRN